LKYVFSGQNIKKIPIRFLELKYQFSDSNMFLENAIIKKNSNSYFPK